MSIFAGVAVLASLALVATPAHASHDGGTAGQTNWPAPRGATTDPVTGAIIPGSTLGSHEGPPVAPVVLPPHSVCAVTGGINTVAVYDEGGPQHDLNLADPLVPIENQVRAALQGVGVGNGPEPFTADIITRNLWNNPAHSHYAFNGLVISCVGIPPLGVTADFGVDATGGNDGHYLDIWGVPPGPGTIDCPDTVINGIPVPCPPGGGTPHDDTTGGGGHHHGSVTVSAWSHSADFATNHNAGPCSARANPSGPNQGYIQAESPANVFGCGWVKYQRVANVVHAWGDFVVASDNANPALSASDAVGNKFNAALVLVPAFCGPNGLLNTPNPGITCADVAALHPAVAFVDSNFVLTGLAVLYS